MRSGRARKGDAMQATVAPAIAMLFSVLIPSKMWFAPDQPIDVSIQGAGGDVTLVLMDFLGKPIEAEGANVSGDKTVNLKTIWPQLNTPGTYVLLAVPKGRSPAQFVGTPLV